MDFHLLIWIFFMSLCLFVLHTPGRRVLFSVIYSFLISDKLLLFIWTVTSFITCKIQYSSSTAKTKLFFNVLPKVVCQSEKKIILGLLFQRIILLPRTECTIHTFISFVRIYVRSHLYIHISIYMSLYHARLCSCPYLLWDRGLSLSPNSALHVWPRISTERPLPVIVGLIRSPQYCFITLIQDCILNLSITHSSFGTHWPGPHLVFPFAT